jgi:hypothetical protein
MGQSYSYPIGGDFVVGDVNPGTTIGASVTFWAAQWWKDNTLSGGTAPASFKGFENSSSAPTCGTNWTANPGNSAGEPANIPSYMAVIVASDPVKVRRHRSGIHAVTMHGSTIQGNTVHMVIVQTNPGYQNNPGHAGTGTIVGVIC